VNDDAWLWEFHAIAADVRAATAPLLGTAAGRVEVGHGAGGDRTLELDRIAEATVLARLRALAERGERFAVLSEEAGTVDMGAPYPLIVIDPVDGSLNAKRGLPIAAVMLSLLDGPTLADTRLGVVHNLFTGERWHAVRGEGLHRDDAPVTPPPPRPDRIEILGLETSPRSLRGAGPLIGRVAKVRLFGSVALSLTHAAAGGIDVFCSPLPSRTFDISAGLLMVREVGGVVTDIAGRPIDAIPAGLADRTTLLCASHPSTHRLALQVLRGD
jgi:myo-inositol-1(or 4)-monophosphatase